MVEKQNTDIETTKGETILDKLKNTVINDKLSGLEKKEDIEQRAIGAMNKIGDLFKIEIPFIGDLGSLFGKKRPIDMLGTKEERSKNKVLNGILNFFGFKKGMEEIHEKYIESQLEGVDKQFAQNCFTEYKKIKQTDVPEEESTRKICGIEQIVTNLKEEEKTKIKEKVPEDFENIKNTLIKELPNHISKLSITTVNMIDPSLIIKEDKTNKIDIAKIKENPTDFIDKYLKLSIPLFVQSGEEFIGSSNVNRDSFVYALFGNLTGEKFFVEGVSLGLLSIPAIPEQTNTTEINKQNYEADPDQIGKINTELKSVKNCPLTAEMIVNASQKYKIPTSYLMAIMKNDSSYGTAGKGAKTHNPGNVGNTDNGNTKDRGTREAGVNAVAENLARRISEYQKIYGKDKTPDIKELAQNKGPDGKGFLSNQANFKKDNAKASGAYMTSTTGQERVQTIAQNLAQNGIANEVNTA